MDSGKMLESRFLSRDSVFSEFVVLVLCICCTRGDMYLCCCVHIVHVVLCEFGGVHVL